MSSAPTSRRSGAARPARLPARRTDRGHQGGGLELADSAGTLDLKDFLIDTQNGVVDANVAVNGQSAGNVAAFDIGADGTALTLTPTAASVANQALGTTALASDTVIGTAAPWPITPVL